MGKKGGGNKSKATKNKEGSKKGNKSKDGKSDKGLEIDPNLLAELNKGLCDCFRFKNGDVYVGRYRVTAEGRVVRDGKGRYFTADNYTICGTWEEDVLKEAERITYPDGSWYQGRLEDGGYTGEGEYNVPQLGELKCTFSQRRPSGLVTLTDIDGGQWQGRTVENSVKLIPRNHFFDSEDKYFKLLAEVEKESSFTKSSIDIAAEKAAEEATEAVKEASAAETEAREAAYELAAAEKAASDAAAKAAAVQAVAAKLAAEVEEARKAAEVAALRADVAKATAEMASAKAAEAYAESSAAKLKYKTNLSNKRSNIH